MIQKVYYTEYLGEKDGLKIVKSGKSILYITKYTTDKLKNIIINPIWKN